MILLSLAGVGAAQAPGPLGGQRQRAAEAALVGVWTAAVGDQSIELALQEDGGYSLAGDTGTYEVDGSGLILRGDTGEHAYTFKLTATGLELSGGELDEPLAMSRRPDANKVVVGFIHLFDITRADLWSKLYRIGFVLAVVAAARLIIFVLKGVSHVMIYHDWGPLAWLYRRNKNRARTVHSLVLNLVKYFIYFTALGMVLSELGVNYAAYFASLSVVGLAIGFGSQGLVQDMVTGFFIVFEGQFDVGDMVEISGQTGYVTEIGLRMTKLRNYLGQVVVIPNRNIAMVGSYSRGAQRSYVDVAVADAAAGEVALPVIRTLTEELGEQYHGVIIGSVKTSGPTTLATGEHFVRAHLSIWPGQTWVIDQQLVPRLREALKTHGIAIPGDRVHAFYHPRHSQPAPGWRTGLPWRRKTTQAK